VFQLIDLGNSGAVDSWYSMWPPNSSDLIDYQICNNNNDDDDDDDDTTIYKAP